MKKVVVMLATLVATGCTVTIKESKFIAQDESVTPYSGEFIKELDSRTPQHQVKPVYAKAKDHTTLNGLFLDSPNTNNLVLYIPGNGMSVEKAAKKALVELAKYGNDIVIFDRRGLGATAGKATIANQVSDANLSFDYVKKELNADKVTLHGYSLGSFIAAQVAREKAIDALVLQGAATNVDDWVDEIIPWYSKPFLNIKIDDAFYTANSEQVLSDEYKGPLLIIAGEKDQQTPAVLSQKLFDASSSQNKQIVIADNAKHEGMFESEEVQQAYKAFLAQ